MSAKGELRYRHYRLAAEFPTVLRIDEQQLTIELPREIQPPAFQLARPSAVDTEGTWTLSEPHPGVALTQSTAVFVLQVPAGIKAVTVVKDAP